MPLLTPLQHIERLRLAVRQATERAEEAMAYAEKTARLHHEAICALNQMITGSNRWPSRPE